MALASVRIAAAKIKAQGALAVLLASKRHLTLSEKRFCRQSGDMWCFDSASPWTYLLDALQSGHCLAPT